MDCRVVITANGQGERMKGLSSSPKHHLYYKDKRIIDHLLDRFPGAEVLEGKPSNSRKESLEYLRGYEDCLIVDCDIIPSYFEVDTSEDFIYYFKSDKEKYSSLNISFGRVIDASEKTNTSPFKSSGVYFVKSVNDLLERMKTDSIAEAMIGAKAIQENDFIKLGDPQDYYEALGIHNGSFTGNRITFNEDTVIKHCRTGLKEKEWYSIASGVFSCPKVMYADREMIITERIYPTAKVTADDVLKIVGTLKQTYSNGVTFDTYVNNIPDLPFELKHPARDSFFHGDLSTHNILKNSRVYLIDPNYKDVFGSWFTDASKAVFSFIAYEMEFNEAKKIVDALGHELWKFAVAEGLRVCKYRPEYKSIVNNIKDLCLI